MSTPSRVVIAGATGFIGTAVCRELAGDYDVVALTRSRERAATVDRADSVRWVYCDLFSAADVRAVLRGVDYAIFLVHSLVPSSRLTQAKPEDLDLLLADIFGEAAAYNEVKQILFIGGIVPEGFQISKLLWSRREVELALGSHGAPVTALRAGLVVGTDGSSIGMLVNLVRRLPVLPMPSAANSRVQPIALADVVRSVRYCLGNPSTYRQHFDIGGPDILSYREILCRTGEILGRRRRTLPLPLLPLRVGAWFIRLVTGAHPAVVRALIESLPHDTLVQDNPVQRAITSEAISYTEALQHALGRGATRRSLNPNRRHRQRLRSELRRASVVRSIQRLILPVGENAEWVAGNYFRWLPRLLWPLIDCRFDAQGSCALQMRFPRINLLTLSLQRQESSPGRRVYFVTSGLLLRRGSKSTGRFEFRDVLGGRFNIAGIHDYAPALPWYVYISTQALVHLRVMRLYQRRLARLSR